MHTLRGNETRGTEMPPNIYIVDPSFEHQSELNNACIASVADASNTSHSLVKVNGTTQREKILASQVHQTHLVVKGKSFEFEIDRSITDPNS
jgi:hypothetical protein